MEILHSLFTLMATLRAPQPTYVVSITFTLSVTSRVKLGDTTTEVTVVTVAADVSADIGPLLFLVIVLAPCLFE